VSDATKIEWTARPNAIGNLEKGYTFNPWIGCTEAGPECELCYAKDLDARYQYGGGTHFGAGVPRYPTSEDTWAKPYQWNRRAKKEGWRPAVFMMSLGDWADREVDPDWKRRALQVVGECPHLEWLLLTKRPRLAKGLLEAAFPDGIPAHVRVGTTCGCKAGLKRIDELLEIEASHFLSVEPLLEEIDLYPYLVPRAGFGIDQVIVGGESGSSPDVRPQNHAWVTAIHTACWRTGTPFFYKQNGEWAPAESVNDVQAKAMCLMGHTKAHTFEDGRKVYRVGKSVAGNWWLDTNANTTRRTMQLPANPMRLTKEPCGCNACAQEKKLL
jgi:protein gp37